MDRRLRVTVLGGAGAMGRIVVRDLVETAPEDWTVVVADRDAAAARAFARTVAGRLRVVPAAIDVTDVRRTARRLDGSFAAIAALQHRYNLQAMRAALAARAHYVDLGGLFHVTRQQLKLHGAFRRADRLAILGMGASPGIVNVLARAVAEQMEAVREMQVFVANVDRAPRPSSAPLASSYSIETVLEEASEPAAVFTQGKLAFVPPMSGEIEMRFPEPIGVRKLAHTLHSEVATLPSSFRDKGIAECSFRIAFPEPLVDRLKFLRAVGLLSTQPVGRGRSRVVPRDLLVEVLRRQPPVRVDGVPDEYEILRVIARGIRGGRQVTETIDCHVPGMPEWCLGIDVDTGSPPSIAVQMLARGEIDGRGCLPPEQVVPPGPFFAELERRRMSIRRESDS
jgi:saccharopine dehydrogenase-like NADP-dependent oxidoreductase